LMSATIVDVSQRIRASGNPVTETATPSAAMLKTILCGGFRSLDRSVLWAHAPTPAMHTVAAGPSSNNTQKYTAEEIDRLDSLRPIGSLTFATAARRVSPMAVANIPACSIRSVRTAVTRQLPPATVMAATYARAFGGRARNVGRPGL